MAKLNISGLTFAYDGGENLFENVSLQIDSRWKLGLIGRNGRGKTTFLRLLMGELKCNGDISVPIPVDYFPCNVGDPAQLTREIIEKTTECEPWQLYRELSLLEISEDVLDRPFETLSGGERTKILLAALFLNENRFLLIDEPTNHLDLQGRKTVADYLNGKSGFILVSHDRTLLDHCVDHIISINRSDIELIQGNFSTWQQTRENRDRFEESENNKLRRDIKRLEESRKRSADWSGRAEREKYGNGPVDRGFLGSKAARMMSRAKTADSRRQRAADEKSNLFKNVEIEDKLTLKSFDFHSKCLVDLSDITVQYQARNPLFENFSLSINTADRLALCGRNGCGKSSLLKLIAGEHVPHTGICRIPSALKISYVPQDTSFLRGTLRKLIEQRDLDESFFKSILHKLGVGREHFETDLSDFSEGQKKKVLLAASVCDHAHLYLWDEPLNYVDVISRIQIEEMLVESKATIVFIEHDQRFLDNVATKIIEL